METKIFILELEIRYIKEGDPFAKFMQVGIFKNKDEAIEKGNEFIKTILKNKFEIRYNNKFTLEPFYINLVSNCIFDDKVTYFLKIREIETDFNNFIKDIL